MSTAGKINILRNQPFESQDGQFEGELEYYKAEARDQREEAEIQRPRAVSLRDKLEKEIKDKEMLRERVIAETHIINGIRMTK